MRLCFAQPGLSLAATLQFLSGGSRLCLVGACRVIWRLHYRCPSSGSGTLGIARDSPGLRRLSILQPVGRCSSLCDGGPAIARATVPAHQRRSSVSWAVLVGSIVRAFSPMPCNPVSRPIGRNQFAYSYNFTSLSAVGVLTDSVWLALQHIVEQPLSAAASSFFTDSRRGKCHGKNSHFQESSAGHRTCHYRRQVLAIGGVITPVTLATKRSLLGTSNRGSANSHHRHLPDPLWDSNREPGTLRTGLLSISIAQLVKIC
jgi:hypothetical protein